MRNNIETVRNELKAWGSAIIAIGGALTILFIVIQFFFARPILLLLIPTSICTITIIVIYAQSHLRTLLSPLIAIMSLFIALAIMIASYTLIFNVRHQYESINLNVSIVESEIRQLEYFSELTDADEEEWGQRIETIKGQHEHDLSEMKQSIRSIQESLHLRHLVIFGWMFTALMWAGMTIVSITLSMRLLDSFLRWFVLHMVYTEHAIRSERGKNGQESADLQERYLRAFAELMERMGFSDQERESSK